MTPGCLFVALPGERTDGHRFLAAAAAAGAAALLVTVPPDAAGLAALGDVTVVVVADALAGLQAVAAAWRNRFAPLVVGVTGSVAKTSTKDATAAVLGAAMATLRTEGNQNNEIGLPLTLLRLGPEHRAAVLEMGMYVGGEIATLAALGRPSIGIVTAVAPVHLGRAGSLEAIADAKAELVEALPADGTAILNRDDPRVRAFRSRTRAAVLTYGLDPGADVTAEAVVTRGAHGMTFELVARAPCRRASTSRSARSAGTASRTPWRPAPRGSSRGSPTTASRQAWRRRGAGRRPTAASSSTPRASRSSTTPTTPRRPPLVAALEVLATLPGRPIAVLGEMRELGPAHDEGHREVGAAAARVAAELVVVGQAAAGIAAGAVAAGLDPLRIHAVADRDEAVTLLRTVLRPGDAVLVKASRGAALETVVDALRAGVAAAEPAS